MKQQWKPPELPIGAQGVQATVGVLAKFIPGWFTGLLLFTLTLGSAKAASPKPALLEQPTFWQPQGWQVAGLVVVCSLQAGLIVGLLMNRARRRAAQAAAALEAQLSSQLAANALARARAEESLHGFSARLIQTQEAERSRLARELHDDITQRLARLAIDVGTSERADSGELPVELVRNVRTGLIQLSEDVHRLAYRLHPAVLEDLGLAAALTAEAEHFERQGCAPITVKVQAMPESVPPEVALGLFRIAQEALRNAHRHAAARLITLSLRPLEDGLQLVVQDDGCGFDPAAQRDRVSLGIASMRERAHLAGGELEIESAPGEGTTILCWLPLKTWKPSGAAWQ